VSKNLTKICSICLICLICGSDICCAQNISNKAVKLYEDSESLLSHSKFEAAGKMLLKAVKLAPDYTDAYNRLAELYMSTKEYENAAKYYNKVLELNPDYSKDTWYYLGLSLYKSQQYKEAITNFKKLLSFKNMLYTKRLKAEKYLQAALFRLNAIEHPVPFNPINMGDSINSAFSEYLPSITADDETLIFTVRLEDGKRFQEDIYISHKKEGIWQKAKPVGSPPQYA